MNGAGNKVGIEADRVITAAELLTPRRSYQFRGEHWSQEGSRDLRLENLDFFLFFFFTHMSLCMALQDARQKKSPESFNILEFFSSPNKKNNNNKKKLNDQSIV